MGSTKADRRHPFASSLGQSKSEFEYGPSRSASANITLAQARHKLQVPSAQPSQNTNQQTRTASVYRPDTVLSKSEWGSPRSRGAVRLPSAVEATLQDAAKDPLKFWSTEFGKLFAMSLGFCMTYVSKPHDKDDLASFVQGAAPDIFDQMCAMLFPSKRDGAWSHVAHLLREDESRPYLAQRIILHHVLSNIFVYEGWTGFEAAADEELREIDSKLKANEGERFQGILPNNILLPVLIANW